MLELNHEFRAVDVHARLEPDERAALADDATTGENSSSSVPGFGVPAALAGLAGAGAWRRFRD